MKSILIIFLIPIILSCSKENEHNSDQIINSDHIINASPDSIRSVICDSTYSIQSVQFYSPSVVPNMGCEDVPTPYDSVAARAIDLSGDSIEDFVVRTAHSNTTFCSSHCMCWNYSIRIVGLDAMNKISCSSQSGLTVLAYDTTLSVSDSGTWRQEVAIHLIGYPYYVPFIQGYIGVRKKNNFGWILISPFGLNGISIKEFAYNHTANNPIRAGQKN
jgi:hypothetical protein